MKKFKGMIGVIVIRCLRCKGKCICGTARVFVPDPEVHRRFLKGLPKYKPA